MGKLIVPLIIGLLMGVSGGGFYSVMQAGKLHAKAVADARKNGLKPAGDSTHVEGDSTATRDSTGQEAGDHADPAGHDSTAAASVAKPTAADKPAPDAHEPDAHAAPAAPIAKPTSPTASPAATPAAGASRDAAAPDAVTQAHQRRLAKIFATMSAKDASRVLAQMTDHDVGIILGLLSDRQAAAILTSLPAPRAAALSQLQPRRGGSE